MACDKPSTTSDCTNVSPCGAGGCGGTAAPAPVLPKCQDTALVAGTFANATVTVSAEGCIVAVAEGEPELYTPDECCGDTGTGGGGTGTRGPKGDPGAAATIDVQSVIGTGTAWSVENTGTTSAAIFKFTAPAPTSGGGSSGGGVTGNVDGFVFADGLVQDFPNNVVTAIDAKAVGEHKDLVFFVATPDPDVTGGYNIVLDIDGIVAASQTLHDAQQVEIDNLTDALVDAANDITTLQNKVGTLESKVTALETTLAEGMDAQFGMNGCTIWNKSGGTVTATVEAPDGTAVGTVAVANGGIATVSPNSFLETLVFVRVGAQYIGTCVDTSDAV